MKKILNELENKSLNDNIMKFTNLKLKEKNNSKKSVFLKIKKYKLSFIFFNLFFISYYLYYLSLERCLDGFDICGMKPKWILKKLTQAIISYFILALLLELMILKIISFFHLFHIVIVYKLFHNYSHGLDFHDHGYFNFYGCISIVSFILIILLPFNGLLFLYKKNKIYIIIYIIFLFIIFIYYLYFAHSYMNCNDWPKGLNNTFIENNIYVHGCLIKNPIICPYKLGKYIFDLTKWKNVKCQENKENTKKKLLKFSNYTYINESTKRIGFPLVNKHPSLLLHFIEHNNTILKYVKNNLVDMENLDLVKKIYKDNKPEIIVDYTKNPYGEMIINLNYNETLSKERKRKKFFSIFK